MSAEREALSFLKQLNWKVSCESIESFLKKENHPVVYFEQDFNDDSWALILSMKLDDFARSHKSFVYASSDGMIVVFVQRGLTEHERLLCLVHECGHIFMDNILHNNRSDIIVEDEARNFAFYVMHPRIIRCFSRKQGYIMLALSVFFALITSFYAITSNFNISQNTISQSVHSTTNQTDVNIDLNENVYILNSTGATKYHNSTDCEFIRGRSLQQLTTLQAIIHGYGRCMGCYPK